MYWFYLILFINFLLVFLTFYYNIMLTLMSLEFLMLTLLMILNFIVMFYGNLFILMYYLIFVVCESVLGLSLLIILIRSKGNDNMKNLNLILW
uniref:NADH dehydrogenase subunit 4L n=1 Tax=Encyrtus eulecaniumiae TaxID=1914888 RepID=A0A7S5FRZ5_9HYME|nr:NADH dehydrogenase subunit 4L [Encyrtus eulecaniumiae]QGA74471.1 NADH dehydrogenase subunit 4L [Encyrtus eulecaniumiae]QGA74484.1 NADH dehydrogenase subunit 4L [Encyrtus eulecaniumiae]QGA74497.1 NADH dehydrogenase subunit 4L [Encyrtus eulecaniumiae]QGA74510.1 NADH dehydrogenase subunit 4L [Encyrtus eulecaniumiae]